MFRHIFYFSIMTLLLMSCNDKKREQFETAHSQLISNEARADWSSKYYVIIPGTGCSGCLKKAQEFMKGGRFNSSDFNFILTDYESKKRLGFIYGDSILSLGNVHLDKENVFYNGGFYSMYPILVKSDSKEFSVRHIDPYSFEVWTELENERLRD